MATPCRAAHNSGPQGYHRSITGYHWLSVHLNLHPWGQGSLIPHFGHSIPITWKGCRPHFKVCKQVIRSYLIEPLHQLNEFIFYWYRKLSDKETVTWNSLFFSACFKILTEITPPECCLMYPQLFCFLEPSIPNPQPQLVLPDERNISWGWTQSTEFHMKWISDSHLDTLHHDLLKVTSVADFCAFMCHYQTQK